MAISDSLGPEREILLSQGPLRLRERGEGPPLLFVHGVGLNADLWRNVVPKLADRWRCIAPDWPLGSHTRPMAPDADLSAPGLARMVVELLDRLGLERVTLVGSDTGGAVCQLVLASAPERVERMALCSCDCFECFPPPAAAHLPLMARIPGALWISAQGMRLAALRYSPLAYGSALLRRMPAQIEASYIRPAMTSAAIRRDAGKAFRGLDKRWTLEAARTFAQRPQPVLLAWSDDGRLFPMALGERLAAALPGARLVVIPDAGAFSPEDAPDAVAAAFRAFLLETDVPARPLAEAGAGA